MQKNIPNRWLDVQIVIATLAMTIILALWNLFASNNRPIDTRAQVQTQPQVGAVTSPGNAGSPVRLLLGGPAPQAHAPSFAPPPITVTSSSQP